jgi:hypothetical protein
MKTLTTIIFNLLLISTITAQNIPTHQIIPNNQLHKHLKKAVRKSISKKKKISEAELADYFQEKFSERFFYDWQTVPERMVFANEIYDNQAYHEDRAKDHIGKYNGTTEWKLGFNYLNGKPVNAYALRHLARQHKMVDVAFLYFQDEKNPKYIKYFTDQMLSLNKALEAGEYEKIEDGNGVYEAFRSGYRVLNWLRIHNMFLGEPTYTDENQLTTIATLLQHGAHLYERNAKFKSGNHQTRGVSALAMLAIILRDFEGTDKWYERAMLRLEEHLNAEINADGFQFERSIHYHISDIENFFFVYQLANISEIKVDELWESKLKTLFSTLVKVAYPDKTAPVLQDDTNIPWAEKNDISGAMTLGYLLFNDPEFGYFASDNVEEKIYWFLQGKQLNALKNIERKRPTYGSLHFPETAYYIMRDGWKESDNMMIISAGVDDKKPDHQHGDILGVQAMANGQAILPNYQVRYSLLDFDLFKNSMVKNVALVDDELQGKKWTSNKGGSGFGKFKQLPKPNIITWQTNDNLDLFVGSHDGFENVGVDYSRQVIYLKNDFWIVKDNFESDDIHTYKQVWQGHYTDELAPNLLRSNFPDASGCDIYQLNDLQEVTSDGKRGKEWSVVSRSDKKTFEFITIIYPYVGYDNRIDETAEQLKVNNWTINKLPFKAEGKEIRSLSKDDKHLIFNLKDISIQGVPIDFSAETDVFIEIKTGEILIQSIGNKTVIVKTTRGEKPLKAGERILIKY